MRFDYPSMTLTIPKLDIETVAVLMRPSGTDASPVAFAAFAVADMVGDVTW